MMKNHADLHAIWIMILNSICYKPLISNINMKDNFFIKEINVLVLIDYLVGAGKKHLYL